VEDLSVWLFNGDSFLFLFNALHQLFSIRVLRDHDVRNTEIGKNDGSDGKKVIHVLLNDGLIVPSSISEFVVLHEECMGNIEFPSIVLRTELSRLSENLLNLGVVSSIPVHLSLNHEDRDVLLKSIIILFQGCLDLLVVSRESSILDSLGVLSENINMLVSELLEFLEGLFFRSLLKNKGLQEFEIFLRHTSVSQISVLSKYISSEIEERVLAVEKQEVGEGLRRERRVREQEVEFLE